MKNILPTLFICHLTAVIFLLHWVGYRLNFTDSMPKGIYQIVPGKPGRKDFITFRLRAENPYFTISLDRHYLGQNANHPLLKVLAGVPGDHIETSADGIRINSTLLQHSQVKKNDRQGRPLPIFLNSTVIPFGKGLAMSTFTDNSFDGRYFGLVDIDQVQRVIPVLTF